MSAGCLSRYAKELAALLAEFPNADEELVKVSEGDSWWCDGHSCCAE
jgi:hypothetical protein